MNADGSWTALQSRRERPSAKVNALALGPDGTIVIGGDFTSVNGIARLRVARLLADGTVDTNFDLSLSGPDSTVSAIAIQPDRKVVIGGAFVQVGGPTAAASRG